MNLLLLALCGLWFHGLVLSLDNGLALTPPMGWLTWERFRCNTDCKNDPDNCIGEKLIKDMADVMASQGYKELGYEYVIIDDCWMARERDKNGRLQPNDTQFPNGMKSVADYIHSKGLKFGIYANIGYKTCAGYPGSEFHMEMDAKTFAEWEADFVKFDGCNSSPAAMKFGYPAMRFFLEKTGRPMVFLCEWPKHMWQSSMTTNYTAVKETCNIWRMYKDVQDGWKRVNDIINYISGDPGNMSTYAGPGGWNDPDMLDIGNFGLSHDQERVQMALWAIMAAPLIMSTDLRNINSQSKALLQNKNLIAVNQDKLGIQGVKINTLGKTAVWNRPISPAGSAAVAAIGNYGTGSPKKISFPAEKFGLSDPKGYDVRETFYGTPMGSYKPNDTITFQVNPTGVFMFTAVIISA